MGRGFAIVTAACLGCFLLWQLPEVTCGDVGRKPNLETLQLVQIIMRHGQRNPLKTYPLDPYRDQGRYWPDGFGQLTQTGVEQTHELGKYIRLLYGDFLSEVYNQHEVLAISSSVERAIRSGISTLRGLYPTVHGTGAVHPGGSSDGESGRNITKKCSSLTTSQVVPIRTVPLDQDYHIYMEAPCPRFKEEKSRYLKRSDELLKFENQHADITRIVVRNCGLNSTRLMDAETLYAFDTLNAQRHMKNIDLPTWVTDDIVHFIDSYIAIYLAGETATDALKRLRSTILDKILMHMENKVKNTDENSKRKLLLWSGHDRTIITALNLLGAYNNLPAPYASAVFIELHKERRSGDYYIEMYYRNDTEKEPYKLKMSFCGTPCLLDEFRIHVAQLVPVDFAKACESTVQNSGIVYRPFNGILVVAVILSSGLKLMF